MSELSQSKRSKILFDGNCVVCDIEVSHYKRIAPEQFELLDISSPDFDAKKFGLDSEAVNRNLHVLDADGRLYVGVEAFRHIWGRIPSYHSLGKVAGFPGVNGLLGLGYEVFVRIRPFLPKKRAAARI